MLQKQIAARIRHRLHSGAGTSGVRSTLRPSLLTLDATSQMKTQKCDSQTVYVVEQAMYIIVLSKEENGRRGVSSRTASFQTHPYESLSQFKSAFNSLFQFLLFSAMKRLSNQKFPRMSSVAQTDTRQKVIAFCRLYKKIV